MTHFQDNDTIDRTVVRGAELHIQIARMDMLTCGRKGQDGVHRPATSGEGCGEGKESYAGKECNIDA